MSHIKVKTVFPDVFMDKNWRGGIDRVLALVWGDLDSSSSIFTPCLLDSENTTLPHFVKIPHCRSRSNNVKGYSTQIKWKDFFTRWDICGHQRH